MKDQREIEDLVLELLTNTSSPFAALYGFVFRELGWRPSVADLFTVLDDLERRGWVRTQQLGADGGLRTPTDLDRARARKEYAGWLDEAVPSQLAAGEVSLDEVGLWVEIQQSGRTEWSRRAGEDSLGDRWILDQNDATRTITVHAEDVASAERVLDSWLRLNAHMSINPETRTVEHVSEYQRRDGTVVKPGIRLTIVYDLCR